MRLLLSIFLSLLGVPAIGLAQSSPVEVRLVDRVEVRAPQVSLGEIALIETEDKALAESLRAIVIEDAPRLGKTRSFPAYRLRGLLKDHGVEDAVIHGLKTTYSTEATTWDHEDLESHIRQWLDESLDGSKEAEVEFVQLPKKWSVPAGKNTEITVDAGRSRLAGSITLSIKALVDGRVYSTKRVRAQITLYQSTAVTTRPLRKGEKVTPDMVQIERSDVTKSRGMEIAQIEDVIGLVANRNLPSGAMIQATDFEQPTIISRGTVTRVVVENGPVRLSLNGAVALQDGKKGDQILFSHPINTKDTLRAQVVRPGLARIKMR